MSLSDSNPSDLDYQGAVIWVDCPLCGASQKTDCASMFFLGLDLVVVAVEPGKVHNRRLQKWLEFKARVVAGAKSTRRPNMQQIPRRSEPHIVSEGGGEDARIYWENRNKLSSKSRDKKTMETEFTLDMLLSFRPCQTATERVKSFLPAKISTDPESNKDLADRLIAHYRATPTCDDADCEICRRALLAHLRWLMSSVTRSWTTPEANEGAALADASINIANDQEAEHVTKIIAFIAKTVSR
jgi:hypothetical protein